MVGLVVVSHSRLLAEGIVELAREMAGPDVSIAAVGGLALPDGSVILGTDPVRIGAAIDRVYSADGVLILVDLGSALLSAEMAVEALPDERRSRVRLGDAPLVEGTLAAAAQARIGSPLAVVADEARRSFRPKTDQVASGPNQIERQTAVNESAQRINLTVFTKAGLHARPAAKLIQAAGHFEGQIRVRNASVDGPWEDGRSLIGLLALDVRPGQEIEVEASGARAPELLQVAKALAESAFGEIDLLQTFKPLRPESMAEEGWVRSLTGIPAVEGRAIGPSFWLHRPSLAVSDEIRPDRQAEWARLIDAIERAETELSTTRSATDRKASADASTIFEAHQLILRDSALLSAARQAIDARNVSAAAAWREAVEEAAQRLRSSNNRLIQERAVDVEDVGRRVLVRLLDVAERPPVDHQCVVLADDLTPSEVAAFDRTIVRAVGLARSSPTSHASILLRSAGIPTVVGLGPALSSIGPGTIVLVDGSQGLVVVDPSGAILDSTVSNAGTCAIVPPPFSDLALSASTRSGRRIAVQANVATLADCRAASAAGADGIGLVRTEFLFVGRRSPPDEDEQVAAYQSIISGMPGRPVTIRTLDAGGDKRLLFLGRSAETNPALGMRGIRLCLAEPGLFQVQLRALLRVATAAPVRILLPMVSSIGEVWATRRLLETCRRELIARGLRIAERVDLGMMVEAPAAVRIAERFGREVDFVSIGTNDLAQYTMAADRDNSDVAPLADALDPSVLRQIVQVADAGRRSGFDVAICGEVAGELESVPLLVGLGISQLSVRPAAVAMIKEAIRKVDEDLLVGLVAECLAAPDAGAVRVILGEFRGRLQDSVVG